MAYYFSPVGNSQILDANGDPLVGGTISTYLAGTSTPATTYTDDTGGTAQGVVMTLDSLGLPENGPVWINGGVPLKFIIKSALGVTLFMFDDVSGIGDTATTIDQWVLYGAAPTYISATSFSVVGDQTNTFQINRQLQSTNSGGTVYSVVSNRSFAAGITTVTVVNLSGALDADLSSVSYSLLSADNSSIPRNYLYPDVRQTVLSGPVDSGGLPNFGGATGSATVTATGTLIATAANGYNRDGEINRVGSITNPSWTGLSTNGTMYLYLDISAGGICTTGSGTLAPTYRFGGADVTTSGQFTFNTQEMSGKVGNGSAAVQTYRVYVGQVTVAGGVVTAIVWYAIKGRYVSGYTSTLPSAGTSVTRSHNIGTFLCRGGFRIKCLSSQANYAVDEIEPGPWAQGGASNSSLITPSFLSINSMRIVTGSSLAVGFFDRSNGVGTAATAASWAYEMWAERSF